MAAALRVPGEEILRGEGAQIVASATKKKQSTPPDGRHVKRE
jgi:hypothetical protein